MKIETKNKVYWAGLVLVCVLALGGIAKATGFTALINVQNGTFNLSGLTGGVQVEGASVENGPKLGSAQTNPVFLTDPNTLSSQDSLQIWGTGTGQGLEVAGTAYLNNVNVTGSFTAATATFGFTPNQQLVTTAAFNAASSTLCSIQNTSGADRVIDGFTLDVNAASSAVIVNSQWRGYVSGGRADLNATATGTLFKQAVINSTTLAAAYGGAVPSSYYTSSTAFQTGVSGISTSTLVMWYNGWFANATSSAITSSTGNCKVLWHGF